MESELLKWIGTIFITVSALQVSFNIRWATEWWAYLGFSVGHLIWSIQAITMQEWSLVVLNVGFIFVDLYAIYIRLKKKNNNNK